MLKNVKNCFCLLPLTYTNELWNTVTALFISLFEKHQKDPKATNTAVEYKHQKVPKATNTAVEYKHHKGPKATNIAVEYKH